MQLSIFDALAIENIDRLLAMLNEAKTKTPFKMEGVFVLPEQELLLVASDGRSILCNVVGADGMPTRVANWRAPALLLNEFGDTIPEPVVRAQVVSVNMRLEQEGLNADQIEFFWAECFAKAKSTS